MVPVVLAYGGSELSPARRPGILVAVGVLGIVLGVVSILANGLTLSTAANRWQRSSVRAGAASGATRTPASTSAPTTRPPSTASPARLGQATAVADSAASFLLGSMLLLSGVCLLFDAGISPALLRAWAWARIVSGLLAVLALAWLGWRFGGQIGRGWAGGTNVRAYRTSVAIGSVGQFLFPIAVLLTLRTNVVRAYYRAVRQHHATSGASPHARHRWLLVAFGVVATGVAAAAGVIGCRGVSGSSGWRVAAMAAIFVLAGTAAVWLFVAAWHRPRLDE
jgi:hypothetical protein